MIETQIPRQRKLILLVDDHAAVRHELALLLTDDGVGDCREVAGREEALDAASRERPDAALVDLSPGMDETLRLVAELSARSIPVVVCSMYESPGRVRRALDAGARGYITKREPAEKISRAVREVIEGWIVISPCAAEALR